MNEANSKAQSRAWYYKVLPMAARQLGWDDDTYRDVLKRFGAQLKDEKYSAATMSLGGLMQCYDYVKKCGFKAKPKKGSSSDVANWRKPRAEKIAAMWIALFEAGVVRDRSEKAMLKWCAGVTGKLRFQWYNSEDLNRCIEGLKKWASRESVKLD